MSIDKFLSVMNANGGMSVANSFVVRFPDPAVTVPGVNGGQDNVFEFLCDEAQLPNVTAATGTIKGRYLGEGQINYPHTRVFSEFQLGFQCDANMIPLKFLNEWYGAIFGERAVDAPDLGTSEMTFSSPRSHKRFNRLSYPDSYCRSITVTKTEIGPQYKLGLRPSVTYVLERAWPYQIDAVPLQFGSNILTKVTAQFFYTRHTVVHNDISVIPKVNPEVFDPNPPVELPAITEPNPE